MRCQYLLATIALVAALLSEGAQDPSYSTLVASYRHDPEAAVARLLDVQNAALESMVRSVVTIAPTGRKWLTDDLNAAALMHTDATATLLRQRKGLAAVTHGDFARRLIDAAAADPEDAWFAYQWYAATIASFEADGGLAHMLRESWGKQEHHRSAALFKDALESELIGCGVAAWRTIQKAGPGVDSIVYPTGLLTTAATRYEKVLELNPRLLLASVHLGRIHMLRGDDQKARMLLEHASHAQDRQAAYGALMFLAAIDEREQRFEEAEHRYESALALFPAAQSPRLALAALSSRLGRPMDVQGLLEPAIVYGANAVQFDPWWSYLTIQRHDDPWSTITRLRAGLLQ